MIRIIAGTSSTNLVLRVMIIQFNENVGFKKRRRVHLKDKDRKNCNKNVLGLKEG